MTVHEQQEHDARLVEEMIPCCETAGERIRLRIAANAIRRGRHLLASEKLHNLAKALAETDAGDTQ